MLATRFACTAAALLIAAFPCAAADPKAEQKQWIDRMFRGVLLDGHIADASWKPGMGEPPVLSRRDARKLVSQLKQARAQYVYFDAKALGGFFYNSDAYPQYKHPALGAADFFGEFVRECRTAGILPFAYVAVLGDLITSDHPEWRVKYLDGSLWERGRARFAVEQSFRYEYCINGPGRNFFLTVVREVASKYDVAGFWLDGMGAFPGGPKGATCGCDYCKARFKKDTGRDLPKGPSDASWPEFNQWRRQKYDEYCADLRDAVHSVRPQAMVARNFSDALDIHYGGGGGGGSFVDLESNADTQDFISHELRGGNIMGSVWPRALRALSGGGKPIEMEVWRFNYPRSGGTYNLKSVPWLLSEMYSAVANGSKIQLYDNLYPDGTMDQRVVDAVGTAFAEIEKREPWLAAARPVSYAAVLWSKATSRLHQAQRTNSTALLGLCQMLLRSHLPFEFITDRDLRAEKLKAFRVLVLSDAKVLTGAQLAAVREYVRAGGGVVATYETSLWEPRGQRAADFALADVLGISFGGSTPSVTAPNLDPEQNSFIKLFAEHPVTKGIDMRMPLATQNTVQLQVKPRAGAESLAKLLYAYRNTFGYPPSEEETGYAGLVVNHCGQGRTVYFPADLGSIYYDYGGLEYRALAANAIRWAGNSQPPVEVEAPSSVETTVFHQEAQNRLVVHLVNFQSQTGRAYALRPASNGHLGPYIEDVVPAHDIKVTIRVPEGKRVKSVYLAPEREAVRYRRAGDSLTLVVPKVEQHRMVVVEFHR
jgi:uncharacterized lipoprotein YddW (UPF0748 family)